MVYGLLTALHAGYEGKDRRARLQQQVDLLVWRLSADLHLMERFYRAPGLAGNASAAWFELDSKLKLLGHAEECLAFATQHEVVKLTGAQQTQRRVATAALLRIIEDLKRRDLGEARALNRDLYQQLVGDTCHARHGLTLDRSEFSEPAKGLSKLGNCSGIAVTAGRVDTPRPATGTMTGT